MLQLRAIRKRRGMDAKRLAALLGVKTDRVYAWETERAEIPLHFAIQCADIFRCSLDELAGRETPPMSDDARMVLELYAAADETGQAAVRAVADAVGRADANAAAPPAGLDAARRGA